MKHASLEELQTSRLIADIRRVVDILNGEIAEEEKRCGVSNRQRPDYPMHARALIARRDNLKSTIALLEKRFGLQGPPLPRRTIGKRTAGAIEKPH